MKITTFNNLDEITGNEGKILLYDEAKSKIGASTETVNEIIQDQVGGDISRLEGRVDTVESNLTSATNTLSGAIALKADADKVYTKTEVDEKFADFGGFEVTEGDSETGEPVVENPDVKKIYLVKKGTKKDKYCEWIWSKEEGSSENTWVLIGETTVDLSDYAKTVDVDAELALKEDKVFVAEYNVTPYADIKAAYDDGRQIVCKKIYGQDPVYVTLSIYSNSNFIFQYVQYISSDWWACLPSGWSDVTHSQLTAGTDLVINNSVIGVNTNGTAQGTYAFVEGQNTSAIGDYSHTEGFKTIANNLASHAEGECTIAGDDSMHVGGKYNSTSSNAAFVIGNGNDSDNRSDAFIVDWTGIASATKLATSGLQDVETAITSINGIPASTTADAGKVLTVDSSGIAEWATGGTESNDVVIIDMTTSTTVPQDAYTIAKTALNNNKIVFLRELIYGYPYYYQFVLCIGQNQMQFTRKKDDFTYNIIIRENDTAVQRIEIPDVSVLQLYNNWDSSKTYNKDDVVIGMKGDIQTYLQAKVYISKTDNNTTNPIEDDTNWEPINYSQPGLISNLIEKIKSLESRIAALEN